MTKVIKSPYFLVGTYFVVATILATILLNYL
jgi:hypothetical protein